MKNPIKAIADAIYRVQDRSSLLLNIFEAVDKKCPMCSDDLTDHTYGILGQQFVTRASAEYEQRDFDESSLSKSWKECNWRDVVAYCDSATPALHAGALWCPRTKQTQALLLIVPLDYVGRWIMLSSRRLSGGGAQEVKALIDPLGWVRLG